MIDVRAGKDASLAVKPVSRARFSYRVSILVVALAIRLGIIAFVLLKFPGGWLFRSQGELGFLAQSLLAGHGMSSPFGGSTGPTAFLAPGYPVLIALIFSVFGVFTTSSAVAVMLLQTFFCLLTIYLIMEIAEREFGTLAAKISGISWAIGLPYVWLPAVFWDTSLTILLMIGSIAFALRCARAPSRKTWALMGFYGGCAMLVNPSFLLGLLAVFGWTVYQTRSSSRSGPVLSVLILLAIFAPWPIRNYHALHAFIPLRSNFGFEFWKGNRSGATTVDDSKLYPVFNRPEYERYASLGEVAFMRNKSAEAKQFIVARPADFIRLSVKRFFTYWAGVGNSNSYFLPICCSVTTILGALGLVWLVKEGRGRLALLLFLPLLLYPLPFYITHAEIRFRLIVEPITTILSAYAVVRFFAKFSHPRTVAQDVLDF